MGLIANNIIVGNQTKTVTQQITEIVKQPELKDIDTSEHHILVVNGKHKKLSKRSSYLLDMLEIEEEQ